MTPALLDLSRAWTLPDIWPADAAWNVMREPALEDLPFLAAMGLLVWFAMRTRKGMK